MSHSLACAHKNKYDHAGAKSGRKEMIGGKILLIDQGCGRALPRPSRNIRPVKEAEMPKKRIIDTVRCACGCGELVLKPHRFVTGHNFRKLPRTKEHCAAISAALRAYHEERRGQNLNKVCPSCKRDLPPEAFGIRSKTNKAGRHYLRSYCKECAIEKQKLRKFTTEDHRRHHLKWKYGLTQQQYEEMLCQQGGKCAICGTTDPGPRIKHFHVDHCHKTGKIRDLLCTNCNSLIGHGREDMMVLRRAIEYLERHR